MLTPAYDLEWNDICIFICRMYNAPNAFERALCAFARVDYHIRHHMRVGMDSALSELACLPTQVDARWRMRVFRETAVILYSISKIYARARARVLCISFVTHLHGFFFRSSLLLLITFSSGLERALSNSW